MSSPSSAETAAVTPPAMLSIHLDLVGGIAGDMFVAAMVDALPALARPVLAALATMQPVGSAAPAFHETTAGGLRARRFGLTSVSARGHPPRADVLAHEHAGAAYSQLRREIGGAPLSEPVRRHALALLALLAEAEAKVHGIAADDVHFHELGDWDSMLDIVAAGCIAAELEGAHWTSSAPPLGGGQVHTEHGVLPVPAPATTVLLTGYPWRDDGVGGERVTPTGAAILRHLVPAAACAASRGSGRLAAVGCGAGTRQLPGIANIVRALVFEHTTSIDADTVALLEFDVDDMTGEEIALAAERLRAKADVIDVSIGTRIGKKGRPLVDFRLLGDPQAIEAIARECFIETSTLGLRVRVDRRRLLPRAEIAATAGGATLRVKVAERPGGERTAKTAHDDVVAARGLGERRRARSAGERRALESDSE
jgi:pyridinium-3,5-bisthiocarboxylic acid mononucleotide nickel chelatase